MESMKSWCPSFSYNILWSRTTLGIGINEVYGPNLVFPVNGEYYFWPREDGWKLLKEDLENKPFFSAEAKIEILYVYTQLIQFWTTYPHGKKDITQAQLDRKFAPVVLHLVGFF